MNNDRVDFESRQIAADDYTMFLRRCVDELAAGGDPAKAQAAATAALAAATIVAAP